MALSSWVTGTYTVTVPRTTMTSPLSSLSSSKKSLNPGCSLSATFTASSKSSSSSNFARRSEEHTSELQSRFDIVCRLLLEKKNIHQKRQNNRFSNSTYESK